MVVKANKMNKRSIRQILSEPTTWAGFMTIAAALATGSISALTDPVILGQVGAGLALVLAREGS